MKHKSRERPSAGLRKVRFGELLKQRRTEKGLTLESLAKKVGVGKSYMSLLERGKTMPPSPKITVALARELGLGESRLLVLGWAEKAPPKVRDRIWRAVAHLVAS